MKYYQSEVSLRLIRLLLLTALLSQCIALSQGVLLSLLDNTLSFSSRLFLKSDLTLELLPSLPQFVLEHTKLQNGQGIRTPNNEQG